jgi:hypothetical protein
MRVTTNVDAPWTDYNVQREESKPADNSITELQYWFALFEDELHSECNYITFGLTGRRHSSLCCHHFEVGCKLRIESTRSGWIVVSSEIDTWFIRVGKDAFRYACFLHQQL